MERSAAVPIRRLARLVAASSIASAALGAAATSAVAECDGPYPSFRRAAPTAVRAVVGDVVALKGRPDPEGRSTFFVLRVSHVLRGTAPGLMTIRNQPSHPCAPWIMVRSGDRIAVAFEGTDFEPPTTVNAAAWIRGEPPEHFGSGETITLADVYGLFGLAPPDTAAAGGAGRSTRAPEPPLPLLLAFGGFAAFLGWRRFGVDSSTLVQV